MSELIRGFKDLLVQAETSAWFISKGWSWESSQLSDRVREEGHSVCELGTKNGRNGAHFVVQMWATQKKAVVNCAGRNSDYTDYLQVDVIPKDSFLAGGLPQVQKWRNIVHSQMEKAIPILANWNLRLIMGISVEPTKALWRGKVNTRHLPHPGTKVRLQVNQLTVHFMPLASFSLLTIT